MGNVLSYENRVIAFVDILGFQSILNNTQVIDEKGERVDNKEYIFLLYKTFERISDLMSVNELPDNAAPSRQGTQFQMVFLTFVALFRWDKGDWRNTFLRVAIVPL